MPPGILHGAPAAGTAAILIIGNEILSGKTQDANTGWIARQLKARGIRLLEVRVVADVAAAIAGGVNALREKYDFVFTTGGIGPTHDDITAESISAAFGLAHVVNAEARARMEADYARRGIEMNAARLRMATMPETAELILPRHSSAPGFKIGNVFVLAGIPSVMQDMWTHVETFLPLAAEIMTETVSCTLKEGDIADDLTEIQRDFPEVEIGSYPVLGVEGFSVSLALSSSDTNALARAKQAVEEMVRRLSA
jgi:molybdenum cofactor synthesis domain-containing protein